ncbi:MAG: hypothetical protein LBS03_07445 [Bacteroidales bacterium]|jgi:hypothetical protein|nr:hypothetical protein [Bacteroidales bacterium]
MRTFVVILSVLLFLAGAAFSVYFVLLKEEPPVLEIQFDAVPPDAGIIVDVRDYGALCELMKESPLWTQLCKIASPEKLTKQMAQWQALIRGHVVFSVHPLGKEDMGFIGYMRMSGKEAENVMLSIRQQWPASVFSDREYDKIVITEVIFSEEKQAPQNFFYAFRNGYLLFSPSSILLENALRQLIVGHNITDRGGLANLVRTAGKNAAANVYLHYEMLPRALRPFLHPDRMKTVSSVTGFADWTALDLTLKPEWMMFNGFTGNAPHSDKWLPVLQTQPPLPVTLTDAMPPTTCAFFWMGIRHIRQYFNDYGNYSTKSGLTAHKKEQERIRASYGIRLENDFSEQFENEIAQVYPYLGTDHTAFTLCRIKSTSAAIAMIENWQVGFCGATGDPVNRHRAVLPFDEQLSFTAYHFPFDVPFALFGKLFKGKGEWCAVADNYLLFGPSPEYLKRYLHYTALHASLQTDLTFGRVANEFSSKCNLMFYCNPAESADCFQQWFGAETFKELENAEETLSQVPAAVFQLSVAGEMYYNNFFLKLQSGESAARSTGLQTSWESLLDTAITFKPQLLQNHNTGKTEVFVQDMAGNACLLNNIGRILWKIRLPEAIQSSVYQIDIYKNNKLQMLFNTRHHIYAVDRLGNMVDGFPVRLPSAATGSIAVFDYENNRDYRIMVACENRNVYAYDKNGASVAGWKFIRSEHPVQTGVYHHRAGNKDFIIFADKYKVYILDRQGRTRVSTEYNFPVARNTAIAMHRNASIVLTDTAGTPHFISLSDGKIQRQPVAKFSSGHFFDFQDTDGDGRNDFIFADKNKIDVFRQDGSRITAIETDEPVRMRPGIYTFSATDIRLGTVAPQKNLIYLYNSKGELQPGFPLTGSTPFSIGRLDKLSPNYNLLVGSKNNYLYNYPVGR